ncbi:TrkH family potassium uptake protein [Petroclostridium sp. X23]|uniref:TrkH family potassium uptake protein n=1 Tax=Petroclostridium sp. X23 TaxID=3045146 RepID=UPI0024AD87DF|nr:TrkH family potassium uptake protein [Petroclostridium sp. X23]WHH59523.1 TrkH family potassium uptake protein [Petroclostridium sp. X23]
MVFSSKGVVFTNYINKRIIKKILSFTPAQLIPIGFATVILIGAILLNLPIASRDGQSIGFINALFTATSAVCVTGLVVVDTYTHWTLFGQITILFLIQIGGLGFMTMATLFSLVLGRRIGLKERLLIAESLNQCSLEGMVRLTKQILLGTLLFEMSGAIILSIQFIGEFGVANGIYKGIFHAISAFCNAGFDLMGEKEKFSSLVSYVDNTMVNLTIMALIVIGGLGFSVWDDVYRVKRFKELRLHTKLVLMVTAVLLITGFLFFALLEYNNPNTLQPLGVKGKFLATMFQSVTPRTAGFNTLPLPDLTNASKFFTIILMFIGGSPGSTAGGIKTATAGVLIFAIISVLKGSEDTNIFERRVNVQVVLRALAITVISLSIVVGTTVILSIFEQASFMEMFFEAVSAFGTVGLSLGITPSLSTVSKLAIIMTMFFGRVGVLTMALALTIKMKKSNANYKYPEGKIMVG